MTEARVSPPSSRNSPCPCGSGRRYKDCHGALGAGAAVRPVPTSSYRAPREEWEGIPDTEADRLGALMERALGHQRARRDADAARLYREVLQAAPRTHDALHMLGVIELGAGNLEEAESLIAAALALRPAYPTITHNRQLVHDAVAARDRALPEALCERALPLLVELALKPAVSAMTSEVRTASMAIHLIGPTGSGTRDESWLMRRLAAMLAPAHPSLWSTDALPFGTLDGMRVQGVDASSGFVPRGGVHVFAGVGLPDLAWLDGADADRVVVVCTAAPPSLYLEQLRAIAWDGARRIELLFTSPSLAARFGDFGAVLPLPIESPRGTPTRARKPVTFDAWTIEAPAPFVVGIVGQDGPDVDEARGVEFLSQLARAGGELAIYDPGRLRYSLGGNSAVRCIPRTPAGFAQFLSSIDCFLHRPRVWWEEGDGRPLLEAMASGVVAICPHGSLFAAEIRDGIDGVLYADDAEAVKAVTELARAPAWRDALGAAARARSADRFDPATLSSRYHEALLGERTVPRSDAQPMRSSVS